MRNWGIRGVNNNKKKNLKSYCHIAIAIQYENLIFLMALSKLVNFVGKVYGFVDFFAQFWEVFNKINSLKFVSCKWSWLLRDSLRYCAIAIFRLYSLKSPNKFNMSLKPLTLTIRQNTPIQPAQKIQKIFKIHAKDNKEDNFLPSSTDRWIDINIYWNFHHHHTYNGKFKFFLSFFFIRAFLSL